MGERVGEGGDKGDFGVRKRFLGGKKHILEVEKGGFGGKKWQIFRGRKKGGVGGTEKRQES